MISVIDGYRRLVGRIGQPCPVGACSLVAILAEPSHRSHVAISIVSYEAHKVADVIIVDNFSLPELDLGDGGTAASSLELEHIVLVGLSRRYAVLPAFLALGKVLVFPLVDPGPCLVVVGTIEFP